MYTLSTNKQAGLTLIELLVVLAIIGLLASVVVPRLNSARDRGADALVKTNMSGVSAQAEIVFDTAGDYSTVCDDSQITQALEVGSERATGVTTNQVCNDVAGAWAASIQLRRENQASSTSGTDYWCTDNTGQARLIDTQITTETSCL